MKMKFAVCAMLLCIAVHHRVRAAGFGQLRPQRELLRSITLTLGVPTTPTRSATRSWRKSRSRISTRAMQDKGLQMVQESQNPDLILTANGGMRQQTSYSAWGMRGIGGGMGGISPEQNVEATMIVDLYDAKTTVLDLARNRPEHPEQQRQQEPGDGPEGRYQDVQAVAEVKAGLEWSMKTGMLVTASAAIEAATGVALIAVPDLVARLLLGVELSGSGVAVARVAGFGLLALGLACSPGGTQAAPQATRALFVYNSSGRSLPRLSASWRWFRSFFVVAGVFTPHLCWRCCSCVQLMKDSSIGSDGRGASQGILEAPLAPRCGIL